MPVAIQKPKPKKQKLTHDERPQEAEESADTKQLAEGEVPSVQTNSSGEKYFDLSDKRRCTIREFKGKTLIDIREMYEKSGSMLPGKKGISLSLEQYQVFAALVKSGAIEEQIQKVGK